MPCEAWGNEMTISHMTDRYNALREQTRVRDARVEPPPLGERVLVWQGVYWAPGCSLEVGRWNIEWRSGFPAEDFPFWLPMPPPPEVKP